MKLVSHLSRYKARYGTAAAAGVALFFAGPVPRHELWQWFLSKSDFITIVAVFGAIYRLDSKGEHKASQGAISAINDKLENGIKAAILQLGDDMEALRKELRDHLSDSRSRRKQPRQEDRPHDHR